MKLNFAAFTFAPVLVLLACTGGGQPASLEAAASAHNWNTDPAHELAASFSRDAKRILGRMTRPEAIAALQSAGYDCIYGEAHADYPDPAAQCTRSFATRACQLDWEIFHTAEKGRVDDVDAIFSRDCVGTDRDWPVAKASAIDDQLAPAPDLN